MSLQKFGGREMRKKKAQKRDKVDNAYCFPQEPTCVLPVVFPQDRNPKWKAQNLSHALLPELQKFQDH